MSDDRSIPIFLVGALRSGTTVSHLMLDSHPEISNPGEYDFFFDYISDEGVVPDTGKMMEQLEKDRIYQHSGLKYDPSLEYRTNLLNFFQHLSAGKENLIINIHRNYHRIIKVFPDARFLHLLRDPRDVARSSIGMGWAGNVYYGVDHWIDSEESWDLLVSQLRDGQYMEFTFENLILQPDDTLTRICDFIGVEFTQRMYDYQNQSTYHAPDSSLVWQWKTKSSDEEVRLVEAKAGNLMRTRGYAPVAAESTTIGFGTKLRLLLQNKFAQWNYGISKLGFTTFLLEKITRKLGLARSHAKIQKKVNAIYQKGLK